MNIWMKTNLVKVHSDGGSEYKTFLYLTLNFKITFILADGENFKVTSFEISAGKNFFFSSIN